MPISPTDRTDPSTTPPTLWPARGRFLGSAAAGVLRRHLQRLKDDGAVQDFLELPEDESPAGQRVFEARWQVPEAVTVRARLTVAMGAGHGQEWLLVAEAERPWDLRWPSPAGVFWPAEPDGGWAHESATGLRFLQVNALPEDDKALRRVLKDALRDRWSVHVVVHEAMTPDERGRGPLTRFLPPGLHHRVVEHRAAPHQLRALNYALRDAGVEVPRGGAAVLPGAPVPDGWSAADFSVRSVFLDGSEPVELVDAVTRFAALARPLPDGAAEQLGALREGWHLYTLEEELERQRALVAMYAEALEAMTRSRDLYREAAERAHEALAAYRETAAATVGDQPAPARPVGGPLQQLTRTFERLKISGRSLRPAALREPAAPAGPAAAEEAAADGTTSLGEPSVVGEISSSGELSVDGIPSAREPATADNATPPGEPAAVGESAQDSSGSRSAEEPSVRRSS
ncbi:hypothetical protein [Streptomyces sp. NPDC049915]|uniref:hypothetical protein n=1 Tax=Streptomyces sp. NPDC049915 TaxID=3155510 RepID=UPI0034421D30